MSREEWKKALGPWSFRVWVRETPYLPGITVQASASRGGPPANIDISYPDKELELRIDPLTPADEIKRALGELVDALLKGGDNAGADQPEV
jgi:hypothetical protein